MHVPSCARALSTTLCGVRLITLATAVLLAACSESPESSRPTSDVAGWHEFQGSWVATGSRRAIPLGGGRYAALVDLTGTLLLGEGSSLGTGFRAEAVALNDSATGLVGRVVWTDERGDQVFSAIEGQGVAKGQRFTGTFIGGTGRYAGANGSYELSWQYVVEDEEGTVEGRAVGLRGRVRFATTGRTSPTEGERCTMAPTPSRRTSCSATASCRRRTWPRRGRSRAGVRF